MERSRKKPSDASSRPRVDRFEVIATLPPSTVAYPLDGPVDGLAVHERLVGLAGAAHDRAGVEGRHRRGTRRGGGTTCRRRRRASRRTGRRCRSWPTSRSRRSRSRARATRTKEMPGNAAPRASVAAALEVQLEKDPGVVVPDLRPGDEERLSGRRPPCADEQRVRHRQPGSGRRRRARWSWRSPRRRSRCRPRSPSATRPTGRSRQATLASGSSRWRRSSQTWRPRSAPSLRWSRSRNCDRRTSLPPPEPKTAPISPLTATTSVRVHGVSGSPALRYWALIPAT